MADVAHDGLVLHGLHVLHADHVTVARRGDDDVGARQGVLEGGDLEPVHGGLQGADRVDLGHDDPGALATQGLGAALADVAVAADDGDLAADQDVGGTVDAVDERVAAAVLVVELRLGHRVVHVDGREEELAAALHLVEAVDAGGRLLGDALDGVGGGGEAARLLGDDRAEELEDDSVLLGVLGGGGGDDAGLLELEALVDQERGITTIVEDRRGAILAGPGQGLVGAPPVLLERLTLPCEDRNALGVLGSAIRADGDRRGGVVLCGEDVAAGPAHLGAKRYEGLDQHGSLDGHVKAAGDA